MSTLRILTRVLWTFFENWLVSLGAFYRAILDSILLSLVSHLSAKKVVQTSSMPIMWINSKTENIPKCLHLSRQAMGWNNFWRVIIKGKLNPKSLYYPLFYDLTWNSIAFNFVIDVYLIFLPIWGGVIQDQKIKIFTNFCYKWINIFF